MNPIRKRASQATLIGALGGLLGFLCSEPTNGFTDGTLSSVVLESAIWAAAIASPLAGVLAIAENVLGFRGRWNKQLLPALLLGAVVGFLSGATAQMFYSWSGPNRLTRGLGWALMGLGIGLMLGFVDRSPTKAARGALGGFLGGLLGGLIFDSIPAVSVGQLDPGVAARLIGVTVLGAAIGMMLQLAQELMKTTWLLGTSTGPYEGKQYILAKPSLSVGRTDANDICLWHDRDVPDRAGNLLRQGRQWRWEGEPALINGVRQTSAPLKHHDRISFGSMQFIFESATHSGQDSSGERYVLQGADQTYQLPVPLRRASMGTAADVTLQGTGIVNRHAELRFDQGELKLRANSLLLVNDQELAAGKTQTVQVGDILQIGDLQLALLRLK